jgi:hypothetical protein
MVQGVGFSSPKTRFVTLTNVHFEKIEFVVLVKPESKLVLLIPPRM